VTQPQSHQVAADEYRHLTHRVRHGDLLNPSDINSDRFQRKGLATTKHWLIDFWDAYDECAERDRADSATNPPNLCEKPFRCCLPMSGVSSTIASSVHAPVPERVLNT
jgi:hypothetical protein